MPFLKVAFLPSVKATLTERGGGGNLSEVMKQELPQLLELVSRRKLLERRLAEETVTEAKLLLRHITSGCFAATVKQSMQRTYHFN